MREVVIVGAVRTPIGNFNGALAPFSAVELGGIVIKEVIERTGIPKAEIDEVIFGNVLQAGLGQNPARQAALLAGIPVEVPGVTINKVCGSGLETVNLAAKAIRSGDADIIIAGGMESMTNAGYVLGGKARWGYRMGHEKINDVMIQDGLWCASNDYHMGITAENIAKQYHFTREQLDGVALQSQEKANRAMEQGDFIREIVPITIKHKKGETLLAVDEFPRRDVTLEKLATLRPAFKQDGVVTAGNASGINDGAVALVIMSGDKAKALGLKPMARIVAFASGGVDPSIMGMGPVPAVEKALQKAGLSIEDMDLIEANEAFAAQFLAVGNELGFDQDKVNVNGGAIALGHPLGASGARILVTLLYALEKRKGKRGLATLCIGGGQGVATIVERL